MTSPPTLLADNATSRRWNLVILDAIRGIAAIAVILHHFTLAFLPEFQALATEGAASLAFGWLLNGIGAVYLFFVLSGFVLTVKYFETGDPRILILGAIKRLPRLWPAATFGVLFGFLVLRFGVNHNQAASALTGSPWLAGFSERYTQNPQASQVISALRESLTLFIDNSHLVYNRNLWTMESELAGSFLVFIAAFLLMSALRQDQGNPARRIAVFAALGGAALIAPGYSLAFMSGLGLAFLYSRQRFLTSRQAVVAVIVGTALLGVDQVFVSTAGAVMIVAGAIVPGLAPAFLQGRIGRQLGLWSFPIYIVHTIVIASGSSLAFLLAAQGDLPIALQLAAAFIVTAALTVAIAWPLVLWERWWLPVLNRKVGTILPKQPATPKPGRQ
jgi:peptidoglycan/LPS O-acetylase OafA/YrhL